MPSEAPRRLLVPTALEDTWGTNEHLVFLGEWCKRYERRHAWTQRAHETVRFHWDDREKLRRDYEYLEGLHHRLRDALAGSLNELHQVDYPVRYWQILLDPWLMAFVGIVFDRWECVRIAVEENGALDAVPPENLGRPPTPFSYAEFIAQAAYSDEWNHAVYERIIARYQDRDRLRSSEPKPTDEGTAESKPAAARRPSRSRYLAGRLDRLLGAFGANHDVMFLDSYFGFGALIRLNLSLRQSPRLFLDDFTFDPALADVPSAANGLPRRADIRLRFPPTQAFEQFLADSIVGDVPSCLIERYPALRKRAAQVGIQTKVIVTANAHWVNPCAKTWIAEQTQKGVKLVILEHGGSLPAFRELFNFEAGRTLQRQGATRPALAGLSDLLDHRQRDPALGVSSAVLSDGGPESDRDGYRGRTTRRAER
jgi:putative transferase (TIGR04331 family)